MSRLQQILLAFALAIFCVPGLVADAKEKQKNKKEVIVIHDAALPRSEKEALVILPGLGDSKKRRKHQKRYFANIGYDLFIPDYAARESFAASVENFTRFFQAQELGEYRAVHVVAYILGSWTLNTFIRNEGVQNIKTIVYDRSPLQERAPQVIVDRIPRIGKMLKGDLIKDFSTVPYPPIANGDLHIGIIVESKATKLIRTFKKTAMSYGPIDWHDLDFDQSYDGLIYTRLNHDEMYYRFDVIGEDLVSFIQCSEFKEGARYTPFEWDPFEKYKEPRMK